MFVLTESGALLHTVSGKCLAPVATADNSFIKLQSACNSANAWFQHTSYKSIRHLRSGMCVHLYLGSPTPSVGTKLVIYSGCVEARLQFDYIIG